MTAAQGAGAACIDRRLAPDVDRIDGVFKLMHYRSVDQMAN